MNLTELNQKLNELEEKVLRKELLSSKIIDAKKELSVKQKDLKNMMFRVKVEQKDVDKLTKLTLTSIFASIKGDKSEKLQKEENELYKIKLEYETFENEVKDLEEYIKDCEYQVDNAKQFEIEYDKLLKEKMLILKQMDPKLNEKFASYQVEINKSKELLIEIDEAYKAGKEADKYVGRAYDAFEKALRYAERDVWSDSHFNEHRKHDAIDSGNNYISLAKPKISRFRKELQDIDVKLGSTNMIYEETNRFSDMFFDGWFYDGMVRDKVESSFNSVAKTAREISRILVDLKNLQRDHQRIIRHNEDKIDELIKAN